MQEVEDMFVLNAPYEADRRRIWSAFEVYESEVRRLLPGARLWLDGGFVTLKQWGAPKDVDVCIVATREEMAAVGAAAIRPLLTQTTSEGERIQPMSGLVDGFLTYSKPDPNAQTAYWAHQWSRVRDWQGNEDPARRKGYVEVMTA